uniref:26S proteasome non-ATPase regulatory subunit 3 n=1 Tax=Phallusia mammillata TaxID=59560 RepID=A0A6F9DP69_9ASCI|nr:26S proteasome non-ATPase regulatory subunit 3 [Phallusia mammillata]
MKLHDLTCFGQWLKIFNIAFTIIFFDWKLRILNKMPRKATKASKTASKEPTDNNVEMKDETEIKPAENEESKETKPVEKSQDEIDLLTVEDVREHLILIERSVNSRENRHTLRVLRSLPTTRKRINNNVMYRLIRMFFNGRQPTDEMSKLDLLTYIEESMETESEPTKPLSRQNKVPRLPETEIYIYLLLLIYLIDNKSYPKAMKLANAVVTKLVKENRRSLDPLAAKCYFYYSRVFELTDKFEDVRSILHARLRTAALVHDADTQASLLNLLLRNYLHYNLYDQAEKLASKSTFPEPASNNEWARYLYYTGRIRAVQLEYSEARRTLIAALRKAPQSTAIGFKQTVTKLMIVVELLLGEIPERAQFKQADMKRSLAPYFILTQAVRTGDLQAFNDALKTHGKAFERDRNYTLILRVRHNVIKAGVRRISTGYSRISLNDVASKLQLDSAEDAEFIIAKAIRDGVIEAEINHEEAYVQTKDVSDIYSTREPQKAFHNRISFCLDIYRNSVMAMRFPPKSYHVDLESAEERREREQQDIEFAKEMADEEDDFP